MFKNILLSLIEERGINQRKLSIDAGIPTTTISGWLNANRLPDYHAIRKLAIYFDVSADYLLELRDEDGLSICSKKNTDPPRCAASESDAPPAKNKNSL
ncbi:MAG: helix-turn-helix domain-containing protein [Christensenellaceae bacterium]